jgi:hypothetical protein
VNWNKIGEINMKKTIIALSLSLACIMAAGCSNSSTASSGSSSESSSSENTASETTNKTAAEKTAQLLEEVEFPSMVEVTSDKLSTYYKIEEDSVTEFSAYVCGSGAMPDEFGIFVAVDEDAAAEIKSALDTRIEKQTETYTDYTPDEMYKFDDCFVSVSGNTVVYAVCADNSAAKDILG